MLPIGDVVKELSSPGRGFDNIKVIPGSTYQDNSVVIIVPTRGMIHHRVVSSWLGLIRPMNGKVYGPIFACGHEVGKAYDTMVRAVLDDPGLSKWKYILTLEDDNIQPPDALIRLLESIEWGKYDAVSGIYFTKGDFSMPMCFGDPAEYKRTGVLEFRPRDIREALQHGNIVEVLGTAMGCCLYRMEVFKKVPAPWFQTISDLTPEGPVGYTQDLYHSRRMVQAGMTLAVDLRCRVGHIDTATQIVY